MSNRVNYIKNQFCDSLCKTVVFTSRTQEQVLIWSSYVLVWTSLGPEHNIYFKKKVENSFFNIVFSKGGKAKKQQIKNQSNKDRRVDIHLK